jgi:DNA-binding NarL/FixJ family response regulator
VSSSIDAISGEGAARATVLVVDDHDVFRRGLVGLLRDEHVDVVGEASSGQAAVRLASELRPEVVIMDLNMPGLDGLEATRRIVAAGEGVRVVVLTVANDQEAVIDALLAGASGFVCKDESLERILDVVRAAAADETVIPRQVGAEVLRRLRASSPPPAGPDEARELSEREREVLRLIVEGNDNATIASMLIISPHTVKNHVASIFEKLGVANRLQASVEALRRGLVN